MCLISKSYEQKRIYREKYIIQDRIAEFLYTHVVDFTLQPDVNNAQPFIIPNFLYGNPKDPDVTKVVNVVIQADDLASLEFKNPLCLNFVSTSKKI